MTFGTDLGALVAARYPGTCAPQATVTATDNLWDSSGALAALTLQGITITSLTHGAQGNSITVALVNAGGTKLLALTETGQAISVQLATTAGVITSTTAGVRALLAASSGLVTATGGNTDLATAVAATPLTSGTDGEITIPDGTSRVDVVLDQAAFLVFSNSLSDPGYNGCYYPAGTYRFKVRGFSYLHWKNGTADTNVTVAAVAWR